MKKYANDNSYLMELEPVKVKELLGKGLVRDGKYVIKPIEINDGADYSPISPYDYSKCRCFNNTSISNCML
jgi:hypothetical protein